MTTATTLMALTATVTLMTMAVTPSQGSRQKSRIGDCPSTPNCVSSESQDEQRFVSPFIIEGDADRAWKALLELLASTKRVKIVEQTETYIQAIKRSAIFRFKDDLEFELMRDRGDSGQIAVRSASRVGYSDLGANRRRIERMRRALRARGVIK